MNIKYLYIVIFGLVTPQILLVNAQKYDLLSPQKIFTLPAQLREISDIAAINNNTIACIQDEKGILFQYSTQRAEITREDSFYVDGDYEGIAVILNDIYVLRSDGVIIEIKNGVRGKKTLQTFATNIASTNNEGLCYDKANNRLLIASKSRSANNTRDKRMIYAFDLEKKQLLPDPVFEIDIPEIKTYLSIKYNLTDSVANAIRIRPSAIAIHPKDGKLYMLSATGYLLCVFNEGKLESAERLDPLLFNKAEGITFLKNGDMVISNEGQTSLATMLLFKFRK